MSALIDLDRLNAFLQHHGLSAYAKDLQLACQNSIANQHGNLGAWLDVLHNLPEIRPDKVNLTDGVSLQSSDACEDLQHLLTAQLMALRPWRKGPFDLFGVHVDSEWRSDMKWQRLAGRVDLQDKRIVDVGCGNGYYMLRMLGGGAKFVVGLDPVPVYVMQFRAINKYLDCDQLQLLPIGVEALPEMPVFDLVFSMGVLYHRRSPVDHLARLKRLLSSRGELVLETLIIEGDDETALIPQHRYAGMKNVWSIPTLSRLKTWLRQCGFGPIRTLDITHTTVQEQRQTPWMTTHSLAQFLDPENHLLTIEGYPAPLRVMLTCTKL